MFVSNTEDSVFVEKFTEFVFHRNYDVHLVQTVQAQIGDEVARQSELIRVDFVAHSQDEEHSLLDHVARVRHVRVLTLQVDRAGPCCGTL